MGNAAPLDPGRGGRGDKEHAARPGAVRARKPEDWPAGAGRALPGAGPGVPSCPACGSPLARRPWGWICPECGFHPT